MRKQIRNPKIRVSGGLVLDHRIPTGGLQSQRRRNRLPSERSGGCSQLLHGLGFLGGEDEGFTLGIQREEPSYGVGEEATRRRVQQGYKISSALLNRLCSGNNPVQSTVHGSNGPNRSYWVRPYNGPIIGPVHANEYPLGPLKNFFLFICSY